MMKTMMMMHLVTTIHFLTLSNIWSANKHTINMIDGNDNYDDECKFVLEQDIHETQREIKSQLQLGEKRLSSAK